MWFSKFNASDDKLWSGLALLALVFLCKQSLLLQSLKYKVQIKQYSSTVFRVIKVWDFLPQNITPYMWPGDPVWQKGTYSLSNCLTLWAHSLKMLKDISLTFWQGIIYYAGGIWHAKCIVIVTWKKVMSFQSQKSGGPHFFTAKLFWVIIPVCLLKIAIQ